MLKEQKTEKILNHISKKKLTPCAHFTEEI